MLQTASFSIVNFAWGFLTMNLKRMWQNWLFMTGYWLVVMNAYTLVMMIQLDILLEITETDAASHDFLRMASSSWQFVEASLFGVFFGTLFFVINRLLDRPSINKRPFGQVVFLKSFLYSLGVGFVLGAVLLALLGTGQYDAIIFSDWVNENVLFKSIVPSLLPVSFFIILLNFIIQTSRKVGPGYFIPALLGKYHHPKSETRVFMFIDLRSSATIAEKIGHIRYSRLIQDCFRELDQEIFKYRAQIYQYVGDEVVLTWNVQDAVTKNRCLRLFFAFVYRLEKKREYFLKEYGVMPVFKAGGHVGEVTVAEFGNVKRQIAYHGDVLNTASRIQGKCNLFGLSLLISCPLKDILTDDARFTFEEMGDIELRGKEEKVVIIAVAEPGGPVSHLLPPGEGKQASLSSATLVESPKEAV